MEDQPPHEYNVPLYTNSYDLMADDAKTSASEKGEEHASPYGQPRDTPITQDYGYTTPPFEPRITNPDAQTEHFAEDLESDANILLREDQVTSQQLNDLKEGRDSLAQQDGALEFNAETLKKVDGVLQQLGYVSNAPKAKGGRKRKAQAFDAADEEYDPYRKSYRTNAGVPTRLSPVPGPIPPSPETPMSKATPKSDVLSAQLADDVETLEQMVVQMAKLVEHLAALYDQSLKPYARNKAGALRKSQHAIAALANRVQTGDWEQQAGGCGEWSRYHDVATAMSDRAKGCETAELEPLAPVGEIDATLVAQLTEGMAPSHRDAVKALSALKASDTAHEPALEAQDLWLPTRLACAAVKLLLADNEGSIAVGQFAVDLCGEAVWTERLAAYLAPPVAECDDELEMARHFLADALAFMIEREFDSEAASALREIVDGL